MLWLKPNRKKQPITKIKKTHYPQVGNRWSNHL